MRVANVFAEWKKTGAPTTSLSRSEFLDRLGRGLSPRAASAWLETFAASKALVVDADRIGPPGSRATGLAAEAESFAARIEESYRGAAFEPPPSITLAKELGTKPPVVEGLVSHLLKTGALVRLSPSLVVHRETLHAAAGKLEAVRGRTLSVGDFRDVLGLTRKNLIPLLEHFDRMKLTRRTGDVRVVGG